MLDVLQSVKFWGTTLSLMLSLLVPVCAWIINEWRRRCWEQYRRKEESYKTLIQSLRGFYKNEPNLDEEDAVKQQTAFLDQLNQCWLYCPDEVILKGYKFLSTMHTDKESNNKTSKDALGEFIVAIREDLLSRKLIRKTNLTSKDFQHISVNK